MAVNFKDVGFVNTKQMFSKALSGGYAVPAYNFSNMEQLQAIIDGCGQSGSPVILQVSNGAREYADPAMLLRMAQGAVEMAAIKGYSIPIALNLDHGNSLGLCKQCINSGFSNIMIDGSHLPYEKNVSLTAAVVEYASKYDVTVEGELGVLAGIEDEISSEFSAYTRPEEVEDFVTKTGVDSLAISIGTSHGAFKFKPSQCKQNEAGVLVPPTLRFDILEDVKNLLPELPIVLHGASSVLPFYVDLINTFGGNLEEAIGIPEDQLRKAANSAVCKINIDSDCRLIFTGVVRKYLATNPSEFDPRKFLGHAREELTKQIMAKNETVLGSSGKA